MFKVEWLVQYSHGLRREASMSFQDQQQAEELADKLVYTLGGSTQKNMTLKPDTPKVGWENSLKTCFVTLIRE